MKINVGSQAEVLGTKKISPQGTVAGLKSHAGKDVLLVVPSQRPRFVQSLDDLVEATRKTARQQGQAALKSYSGFRRRHLNRRMTGTDKILGIAPEPVHPYVTKADAWVRASALTLEKKAKRLLRN